MIQSYERLSHSLKERKNSPSSPGVTFCDYHSKLLWRRHIEVNEALVVFVSLSELLKRFEGFFVSKQIKFTRLYFMILVTNDNRFLN